MIREMWNRSMDARRVLSVALGVAACGFGVLFLAVTPGFATSGGANPG